VRRLTRCQNWHKTAAIEKNIFLGIVTTSAF
jgi:hypothetical protein